MKPTDLILRCFAEEKDGYWQVFCVDLNLAAQGDSLSSVKQKLEHMIHDYLEDALVGEDREHANYMLRRNSPLPIRLRYYQLYILMQLMHLKIKASEIFIEPIPMRVDAPRGA